MNLELPALYKTVDPLYGGKQFLSMKVFIQGEELFLHEAVL